MGGLFSTEPDTITRRESVPTYRPAYYSGSSSSLTSTSSSARITTDWGFLASSQPRTVSNWPRNSSSSSSTRVTSDFGFLASSEPRTASNRSTSNLKRVYGYFQCSNCRKSWQSSHVYCKAGTSKVEYGQECKACKVMCKPYRTENLVCSGCEQEDCICTDKNKRHIDPAKHHRKDLCAKCRAGRPCV